MIDYQRQRFEVTVTTWNRDLKGLFDYGAPSDQFKVSTFKISNNCKVFRDPINGQNYFTLNTHKITQNFSFVCKLELESSHQNTHFWVRADSNKKKEENPSNTPYLVLKPKEGYQDQVFPLELGDNLRFGQVNFRVIEVKTQNQLQTLQDNDKPLQKNKGKDFQLIMKKSLEVDQNTNVKTRNRGPRTSQNQMDNQTTRKTYKRKLIKKEQKQTNIKRNLQQKDHSLDSSIQNSKSILNQSFYEEKTINFCNLPNGKCYQSAKKQQSFELSCKICLSNQQTKEDPFISLCLCKGSCSSTHLSCLQSWINSKTQVQTINGVKSYLWKKASCQICKHPFPTFVRVNGEKINLINLELPSNSYIILQNKDPENILKDQRKFVVIDGEQSQVTKVGRNNDSQIKIKDITVSRKHAEIIFQNNKFFVRDKNSKFGTLMKLQRDMRFENGEVTLQMGRCLFRFRARQPKLPLQIPAQCLQLRRLS